MTTFLIVLFAVILGIIIGSYLTNKIIIKSFENWGKKLEKEESKKMDSL